MATGGYTFYPPGSASGNQPGFASGNPSEALTTLNENSPGSASGHAFTAVVSYLSCRELLRLTACSRSIHVLRLEQGLLQIVVLNLSDARLCQYFIDWAQQCSLLLVLDMQFAGRQGRQRWAFPAGAVIEGIIGNYKHLLSVDLKQCDFMTDQAVYALARHCPSLIQIALGCCAYPSGPEGCCAYPSGPEILSDAAAYSIAQHCRQLVSVDLDETSLTDNGAQALASSCLRLRYASVGGTYVTPLGAAALAQRCSETCESAFDPPTTIRLKWPLHNLSMYRLFNHVDRAFHDSRQMRRAIHDSLQMRFPRISIFGPL